MQVEASKEAGQPAGGLLTWHGSKKYRDDGLSHFCCPGYLLAANIVGLCADEQRGRRQARQHHVRSVGGDG